MVRNGVLRLRNVALLAASLLAASCSSLGSVSQSLFGGTPAGAKRISGFLGGVVADEPRAAVVAREVLATGGTAADAAVALGFALSVTLPSRASLGSGGACLAYSPAADSVNQGVPEAFVFTLTAPTGHDGGGRPAAIPALPRGLFALHARYGSKPFESLISPAEQMARFGMPASRAFVRDLQLVAGPLFADPGAQAAFSHNGTPLAEGERMIQPELGATLAQIRVAGVGDFYQGVLARRLADGSRAAGTFFTAADLRGYLPRTLPPVTVDEGDDHVAFLPPPADGGLAAAAAFKSLQASPTDYAAANGRALAVAARWRMAGGDPQTLLASAPPGTLPELPASTTFLTLDRNGNAVACALTMNNLFGTGRMIPGTGMLLAASPASFPPPLLAAAIAWNEPIHAFRAAVGGSGQSAAALAAAVAMMNTLHSREPMPVPVPESGRANVIACSRYLPDSEGSCGWATDPRGAGLAVGSD